jgi:hypothetical protein
MLQRIVALTMVLVFLSSTALVAAEQEGAGAAAGQGQEQELSSSESYQEGRMAARREHSAGGWVVGGLVGGGLFSLLGTGVVTGIAAVSNPDPDYIPDDAQMGSYLSGYEKEARAKNVRAAAISGGAMSALWIILVLSAAAQ